MSSMLVESKKNAPLMPIQQVLWQGDAFARIIIVKNDPTGEVEGEILRPVKELLVVCPSREERERV